MRAFLLLAAFSLEAGEFPRTLDAYLGKTPKLDGVIGRNEYADATPLTGVLDWIPQFSKTTDPKDLAVRGWVKHDGQNLFFAFEVTDDVLYGIDTPRWLPKENPKAHELTREGFPWFGDEMEILLNPSYKWIANESVSGDGSSWQMVCNLTKSRKGGVGSGGILEGEPRREERVWNTYQKWIREGAQDCVAKIQPTKPGESKRYVIEWRIRMNPCVEVEPGRFWSPAMGERKIGLNIALGDLDQPERGQGNFGNFHHEDWWTGAKNTRTQLRQFGTLILHPGRRPKR